MKIVLFVGLIFCLVFNVFASSLEAEFEIDGKIKVLKEGDAINATLRVWPIENLDENEFKKLVGTNLFESFYLIDIESIAPSVNNADVVEMKASFVVVGKVNPDKLLINYHDEMIHVRFKEVLVNQLENKSQDFIIENQNTDFSIQKWLIILLIIAFLILIYVKRDVFAKFRKKTNQVDDRLIYKKMFLEAKERKDYENIYRQKEMWLKYLAEVAPAHHDFFKVLNEHQFKKEWSSQIKNEVDESFEQIRRSIQ